MRQPAPGETKVVGWLLSLANRGGGDSAFYELKTQLCQRYGKQLGHEWQHIVKECWDCNGSGCSRCYRTGIYSERWHQLEVWNVGGYRFHRPVATSYTKPAEPVVIEGRIEKSHDFVHAEARLWLFLLFAPDLLWVALRSSAYCAFTGWPLLTLQRVVFAGRMFIDRYTSRICGHCGCGFIRPHGGIWYICEPCQTEQDRVWETWRRTNEYDDGIPF